MARPSEGIEVGDHVYARHHRLGPIAVKVIATGRDGFTGESGAGERHRLLWDTYLGHKARMMGRYDVVDQGADGAILRDETGKRRYLAGETPDFLTDKKPVQQWAGASEQDDPLLNGKRETMKAIEPAHAKPAQPMDLPADGVVLFAKAAIANRPGLVLQTITDKRGVQTKRWERADKNEAKPERQKGGKEPDKPAMRHGDVVAFRHGDVEGRGKIVASGADGVTVEDDAGRTHAVRHEHLTGLAEGEGEGDASSGTVPPDKFSAAEVYKAADQPDVTPADILKAFPPDTGEKIAGVEKKLEGLPQTIDMHRKDGVWSPERQKLHQSIIDEFLSDERIQAAKPAEGGKPVFTLLGGRGGSGKSWFKGKVYDPDKAIVLDADEIKSKLPEYQSWNAAQVHEESGEIFDRITELAQNLGLNIVHDATMKTSKKAVALVQRFKDAGYRTEAHYMFLPRQEAAKRAVGRFLNPSSGRFVPPAVVLSNTGNEHSFDQVKGLVDAWSFRDNHVAKGQEPKLLSESKNETDQRTSRRHGLPARAAADEDRNIRSSAGSAGEGGGGGPVPGGHYRTAAKSFGFDAGVILFLKGSHGKLAESTRRRIGGIGSETREREPDDVFLLGAERKYPVKMKRDGKWEYSPELLLAAAREARMHGRRDLAERADRIRSRLKG